ncbi:MAG: DUF502 domain-containing protein [Pseudomonadales bacterium]|nr:DUF502 domain-containing protein [Pseudomonadales bacterium]
MQQLGKAFLLGLAAVLPVALTLYLVYVLGTGAERVMGELLKLLLSDDLYWPGMGLVLAVIVITATGFLIQLPGLDLLVRLSDAIMTRIPIVKTVYSTIRDFMDLLAATREGEKVGRPARVKLWEEIELVGLVTDPDLDEDHVLVYLPMSYQLGGYMVTVEKNRLEYLDMSVEDALRYVVTAGIQRKDAVKKQK